MEEVNLLLEKNETDFMNKIKEQFIHLQNQGHKFQIFFYVIPADSVDFLNETIMPGKINKRLKISVQIIEQVQSFEDYFEQF